MIQEYVAYIQEANAIFIKQINYYSTIYWHSQIIILYSINVF